MVGNITFLWFCGFWSVAVNLRPIYTAVFLHLL